MRKDSARNPGALWKGQHIKLICGHSPWSVVEGLWVRADCSHKEKYWICGFKERAEETFTLVSVMSFSPILSTYVIFPGLNTHIHKASAWEMHKLHTPITCGLTLLSSWHVKKSTSYRQPRHTLQNFRKTLKEVWVDSQGIRETQERMSWDTLGKGPIFSCTWLVPPQHSICQEDAIAPLSRLIILSISCPADESTDCGQPCPALHSFLESSQGSPGRLWRSLK